MSQPTLGNARQRLTTLRIIWFALLMGQAAFLAIVLLLIRRPTDHRAADPQLMRTLFYAALGLLVVAIPVGYLVRMKVYDKARAPDGSVAGESYLTGNIILLALCEGVSLFGLVGILLSRTLTPFIWITAVAVVVQLANFPTGGPLREE